MANFSDKLNDELIGHAIDLQRIEAGLQPKVLGALKQLEQELVAKLAKIDPTSVIRSSARIQRLETLLDETTKTIRTHYRDAKTALSKEMRDLVKIESEFTTSSFNKAIGGSVMTTQLPPVLLRQIAKDTLIEGAPSAEWWAKQAGNMRQSFANEVRQGMLRSESLGEIIQRVRGKATGKRHQYWYKGKKKTFVEFAGGMMDTGTRQAEALVRTSVAAVSNAARMEMYKANADVLKGVQALVTLDNRTSTICQARSGQVWDMDGKPIMGTKEPFPGPPPWHWSCRSTLVGITKSWKQLGGKKPKGKFKKIPKSTQSSMDGQVSADLTYEDWLNTKPKSFQLKVLGPTKHKLWKEGKLTFSQMIDQRGNPLTLEELQDKIS